jgi:hypothetical protein
MVVVVTMMTVLCLRRNDRPSQNYQTQNREHHGANLHGFSPVPSSALAPKTCSEAFISQ